MLHDHTLLNRRSCYIYMQPSSFNKAMLCTIGKVGKSRMALKDDYSTSIWQGHVCIATNRYGKYTCMNLTVCIRHPLWKLRQKRHITITELQATYVSTWCSCTLKLVYFNEYFSVLLSLSSAYVSRWIKWRL